MSDFPFVVQRYRAPQNYLPGVWEATVRELEKYPGCANDVWFSTGVGFPPLAWHEEHAARLRRHSNDLRRLGISPSLEFQALIGHGDAVIRSRKADISGKTWRGWTIESGTETKGCNCPRDPDFRAYAKRLGEIYGACGFAWIWIDDDFRIAWHMPEPVEESLPGCFCERCVRDFCAREGRSFSRVELVAALKDDTALLDRWESFAYDSLAEVADVVFGAIEKVSPQTRFGYQHGYFPKPYQHKVYDALFRHSGGKALGSRPGGGAYTDHNPFDIIEKVEFHGMQLGVVGMPSAKIDMVCPEIENCPRNFNTKTARGLVFESLMNLAYGMNALSYFIVDPADEPQSWYGDTYYAPLAAAAPRLKAYRDLNEGTRPGGIKLADVASPVLCAIGVPMTTAPAYACVDGLGALGLPSGSFNAASGMSSGAIRKVQDAADAVSGGRMPVRFLDPVQAMVVPRVTVAGELRSVALVNASIDVQKPSRLALRGLPEGVRHATWMPLSGSLGLDPATLAVRDEGGEKIVDLPRVDAWACGYLSF